MRGRGKGGRRGRGGGRRRRSGGSLIAVPAGAEGGREEGRESGPSIDVGEVVVYMCKYCNM